ncbi:MAG: hypothetical protein OEZ29_07915 [Candidatus Bathyarchaeota archaeon]|nr:hypothetical protein [Candidatus Bathyarchaeota archaeon]
MKELARGLLALYTLVSGILFVINYLVFISALDPNDPNYIFQILAYLIANQIVSGIITLIIRVLKEILEDILERIGIRL